MNAWSAPRPATAAQTSRWTRNGEFLVYLVPVGAISQERYASYVALLQAHRTLPISALTRPGGYAAELSPFRSFSWQSSGAIRFRFVSTAERVESVDGEDVHAWNRPIGVLGICHCPSTPSLQDAYAQFAASIKHFPGTLVQKCFAFEHQFEVGTVEQVAALSNLVMFPVHHELDAGCSTVSLHLQVVLDTVAVTILMSLESTIRAAMRQQAQSHHHHHAPPLQATLEFGDMASFLLDTNVEPTQANQAHSTSSMPLLSSREAAVGSGGGTGGAATPSQSLQAAISSMASTAVSTTASAFASPFTDSRSRRRQIARHRKLFGDYSVLLDCVPDALEHYAAALELLRDEERKSSGASGDVLWLAAALEGYAYCLSLECKDQFVVEIVEKASDAIALYAKAGVSELECQLVEKVGWYCVAVASQLLTSTKGGKERVSEAVWVKRLLWDTLDRGLAVFPELRVQRQVEFVIEASRMLESVGHRRRMAFFLHEAVALLIARNSSSISSSARSAATSPSLQNSTVQRQRDLQAALLLERITAARLGITENQSSSAGHSGSWEVTTLYRAKKTRRGAQIDPSPIASHEQVWLILRFHVLRQLLTLAKMLGDSFLVGKYCIELLQMLPWCDSIASPAPISSKRTATYSVGRNQRKAATGRATGGSRTPAVDQVQRPFSSQRNAAQSAERQGLFAKTSVYFTPPSSVETKAKRYFTLAGSPSATMSSAAASLSSTIASTPRILATPRQQFSAAVNAISTKASPAFASFSHHSHPSPHSTQSTNSSSSPSISGSEIGLSPGDPASNENGFERAQSSGVNSSAATGNLTATTATSTAATRAAMQADRMFEALPVWDIRSKDEVVKIEKSVLSLMETECASLRPSEQAKLPTFLAIEKIRVLAKLDHPFLTKAEAMALYAPQREATEPGNAAGGEQIHPTTAKSDFFYSPFEKQQQEKQRAAGGGGNQDNLSSTSQDSVFPVHEKIELEMTVSNPFGVAIDVQQATAWVVYDESGGDGNGDSSTQLASGAASANAVECYPCSFELSPYEKNKSVILGIQPLKQGSFHVRGCFLKVLSLKTSFALAAPVALRVVGKLPLATLSLSEFVSLSSHSSYDNGDAKTRSLSPPSSSSRERGEQEQDLRVCMFSSETKQCELRIRNVGQSAISKCHLKATVLRRRVVKKTAVVFSNLGMLAAAQGGDQLEQVVETDSITLRCRLLASSSAGVDLSVAMGSGDVLSVQFEILLLQRHDQHRYTREDEPLEEEEEIVWSFVYADDPDEARRSGDTDDERESAVVYYREARLALRLVSLPSLKLSRIFLLPSSSESIPAAARESMIPQQTLQDDDELQPAIVTSAVMDNSHFLLVVEVENPTETAFRFRMRRRFAPLLSDEGEDDDDGGDGELSAHCDVEIGRKCSRRLAIEVPRIHPCDLVTVDGSKSVALATAAQKKKQIAEALNTLVEMEWETYFGTNGKLLFNDSLWRRASAFEQVEVEAAMRELLLPQFGFEISVPGLLSSSEQLLAVEDGDGDGDRDGGARGNIPLLDDGAKKRGNADEERTRSPFVFFRGMQLNGERRELAVRVMEFVPVAFTIRKRESGSESLRSDHPLPQQSRAVQASIEIRISQEGDAEDGSREDESESSLVDESVVVAGVLSKDLSWSGDDNVGASSSRSDRENADVKTHEIQLLFLSCGDFRVSICARVYDGETNKVLEIWSHEPLYICASE